MHLLAGLDRPTSGEVWIDGTEFGRFGDTALTKLRRRHIGFIFQLFNLLPMPTAEENIRSLSLAGRKPTRVEPAADRGRRPRQLAESTVRPSCRAPAAAGRDRAGARLK